MYEKPSLKAKVFLMSILFYKALRSTKFEETQ